MKVIDLLNKIAKGEEVPNEIRYRGENYIFYGVNYTTTSDHIALHRRIDLGYHLNDEIEILDEEDEFIDVKEITQECFDNWTCAKRLNDLIKNQKKIVNKLKEEGK